MNIGSGPGGQSLDGLANSTEVYLSVGSILSANATGQGHGGNLTLWSDGDVNSGATISARGGPRGGSGGHVEISGLTSFGLAGPAPDLTAPLGASAPWSSIRINLTITSDILSAASVLTSLLAELPANDASGNDGFGQCGGSFRQLRIDWRAR